MVNSTIFSLGVSERVRERESVRVFPTNIERFISRPRPRQSIPAYPLLKPLGTSMLHLLVLTLSPFLSHSRDSHCRLDALTAT